MRYLTRTTRGQNKKDSFQIWNQSFKLLKAGESIILTSKTPFGQIDTSRIKVYEVVQATRQKVPFNWSKDSTNSLQILFENKIGWGKEIPLHCRFSVIQQYLIKSIRLHRKLIFPSKTRILRKIKNFGDVRNYEGNRIISSDKSEKLIAERYMTKDGKAVFPLLDPGFLSARVIYDLNGDRKWLPEISTHLQPETCFLYQRNWIESWLWINSDLGYWSKKL